MSSPQPPSEVEPNSTEQNQLERDSNENASSIAASLKFYAVSIFIFGLGWLLAWGAQGPSDPFFGEHISVVEAVLIYSFAIQFAAFIPAYIFQTEKFYDLTGSITYLTLTWYSFCSGASVVSGSFTVYPRSMIATICVTLWALRLGSFLFLRVLRDGKDGRFDEIKPNFARFLMVWCIQGLWVFLTAYAVFIINADSVTKGKKNLGATDYIGLLIWIIGFGIEIVADNQKKWWASQAENKGNFINYGLWYYSRHPNYFGEMTLWWGMFFLSIEVLENSQWLAVLSPIFVFLLINFVSGVPLLEKRADEKFASNEAYWEYKRNTSCLIPLPKGWLGAKNAGPK